MEGASIEIELNGAAHRVAVGHSLQDLVGALSLGRQALAVAVNREVVPRQAWPQRTLLERDKVELVRAIGGG